MSPAIVPSCGAGPSRGSVTQAVVDPFSNPVFDNPDVTTAISQVPHQGLDHSQWETLAVGLLCYAVGFTGLTLPLPSLQDLYAKAHRVAVKNGVAQFIRAHLAPANSPVQSEVLMESAMANQLVPIRSRPLDDAGTIVTDELGICRMSDEFSDYYGEKIWICKR